MSPLTVHQRHPGLTARRYHPLHVLVAGAGGNGSKVAIGLRHLSAALEALNGPRHKLAVTIADGDTIEHHNLARQAFYPSDLGQNKATVLTNRINLSNGTTWRAYPHHLTSEAVARLRPDIVIVCVDTRAARCTIHEGANKPYSGTKYTLDLGNTSTSGQVILGVPKHAHHRGNGPRLPTAPELHPELIDTTLPEDDTPSCSTLESLDKQDLFVNDTLANHALNLLWQLFRYGAIGHHGVYIDTRSSISTPLPVDPNIWRRMRRRNKEQGPEPTPEKEPKAPERHPPQRSQGVSP